MKARFIGDPKNGGHGPAVLPFFGTEFVKGEWRDVPDGLLVHLAGHTHFEVAGDEPATVETPDLSEMTKAELVAYGATLGLTLSLRDTRDELLEAVKA